MLCDILRNDRMLLLSLRFICDRECGSLPRSRYPGPLKLDLRGTCVERDGKVVRLSARELQLLQYFVEHPGVTLSRELLLKEVWAYGTHVYTRTLDVHVANLRQKIENNPKYPALILTVPR